MFFLGSGFRLPSVSLQTYNTEHIIPYQQHKPNKQAYKSTIAFIACKFPLGKFSCNVPVHIFKPIECLTLVVVDGALSDLDLMASWIYHTNEF